MSNAHRPTWTPAMGKETKAGSRSFFQQDYSARTKLKFRAPGQTAQVDVQKRDLRAELLRAEREAMDKKRKAAGLPPLAPVASDLLLTSGEAEADAGEDEQARKRRKILEDAAQLDADDNSDDEDEHKSTKKKGKERATGEDEEMSNGNGAQDDDDDEDEDDSDDSDDDEDDTAALMAELNKIKQERAEEKAKLEQEASENNRVDRETEIAMGNPLLNLQAALGVPGTPRSEAGTSTTGSFAIKRRWDDDLIFKNQAAGLNEKPKKEFVNDILRSEFHRKFMSKFVK